MVTLLRLKRHWRAIQDDLIAEVDADYGVFEGRTFRADRFARWLEHTGIPWPRLQSGRLDLSNDAFREAARAHPIVAPLRELRGSLSEMRLSDLAVGRDGRNRTLLSAFRARTSRNQPSNTRVHLRPERLATRNPILSRHPGTVWLTSTGPSKNSVLQRPCPAIR